MIETPLGIRDQECYRRIENIYEIEDRYQSVLIHEHFKELIRRALEQEQHRRDRKEIFSASWHQQESDAAHAQT